MLVPEQLYELSQRDRQVSWLDPQLLRVDVTDTVASSSASSPVPEGRALLLQHVEGTFVPGAGQNITLMQLDVRPRATGIQVRLARSDTALAANVIGHLDWQGTIWLPPGAFVFALATFNSGVAANQWQLSLSGMLIPAGNLQRL